MMLTLIMGVSRGCGEDGASCTVGAITMMFTSCGQKVPSSSKKAASWSQRSALCLQIVDRSSIAVDRSSQGDAPSYRDVDRVSVDVDRCSLTVDHSFHDVDRSSLIDDGSSQEAA
jgi:hypothetical protein